MKGRQWHQLGHMQIICISLQTDNKVEKLKCWQIIYKFQLIVRYKNHTNTNSSMRYPQCTNAVKTTIIPCTGVPYHAGKMQRRTDTWNSWQNQTEKSNSITHHRINLIITRAKDVLLNINHMQAAEIPPGSNGMAPCAAAWRCLQWEQTILSLLEGGQLRECTVHFCSW